MTAGLWCFLFTLLLAHRGSAHFLDSRCSSRNVNKSPSWDTPWMAVIASPTRNCSGMLIYNQHVITSASCVSDPRYSTVWLGNVGNLREHQRRGVKYSIQTVYTHKLYNKQYFEYDIAILVLEGPVTYQRSILPICISLDTKKKLENLKANRWGLFEQSIFPRTNTVRILNVRQCRQSFGITIKKSQICAGFRNSRKCTEPGSPLVQEMTVSKKIWNTLIGIQSGGSLQTCIYNKISNYIDWIVGIVLSVDIILPTNSSNFVNL
ncbi:vitamin K-dependent protein C [Drosophila santomea]|uniref:vitamin K-dependent protein C n=1 Tax=Drosophila santomea TaxID=129105 RepID=UPI001952FBD8|nr:vitamin K-dependent protein C [Drosophila santomea]